MIFKKRETDDYSLSMTPLIDVVFLLLIFFMVSTQFIDFSRRMDIQLPDSKAGAVDEKILVLTVEMTKEGRMFLNGEETSLDRLESQIRADQTRHAKKSAVIRADKSLPYGEVVEVMGIFQHQGIKDIGIVVK
jgi:biopolymer transport protein ExbD